MLNILQMVAGRPWAISADIVANVRGLLSREGIAGLRHLASLKDTVHMHDGPRAERGRTSRTSSTVGVVPIIGVMTQRGDVVNSVETRSTSSAAEEVTMMAGDPKVDSILLEIDSPGGEVYGVPELWQAIYNARKSKAVVAHANSLAASAALYAASAADEFWITPSGEAGSLGVYSLHVDESKAAENQGVRFEFIVADESPYKVEGNPFEPLSSETRDEMRKQVNRYMSMFVRDVARGRGVSMEHVRKNFGQGRMLGAQEAVSAGMANQVGTLEQAIRRAAQLGREKRTQQREREAEQTGYRAEEIDSPPLLHAEGVELPAAQLTEEQLAALRRLGSL